ncbi:unnamed protein product [Dracunculus medinensis]|uniref:J domain-containing protein n=1 Tax=Dracunculus medinensis TaxID=318479 RepID=A0A3P7Q847_DRAME|nr:unnamed protein product [Dracunculus medinensis]
MWLLSTQMDFGIIEKVLDDHVSCKSSCDFYSVLGCSRNATTEQILAEYRARVRSYHPDTSSTSDLSNERFLKLQEAKEVLSDEKMRKEYNKWLDSSIAVPWKLWLEHNGLSMV